MGGGTMGGEEDTAGVNPGAKEGKDQQRREVLRRVRQCEYVFMWSRYARGTRFARLIKISKKKFDVSVALRTF